MSKQFMHSLWDKRESTEQNYEETAVNPTAIDKEIDRLKRSWDSGQLVVRISQYVL